MADVKKVLDLEQLTYYNTALKGKIRWFGTHAQYDAIAVKDPSTIYFITDSQKIIRDGKEFGGIFNIHKRTSEPTPGFGAVGDFAIVTESSSSPYGDIYYKINAGSWTNITGARLDKENSFSFGASFGGSVDLMDGTDILRISRTKLSQSSDMFNWYDIEIPTVTANDEMALKSKTQTKIAFSTTSPTAAIGSDGDLYVQYTETSGVISDPKLYGKISGVWYLLGGGGGTMDSEWKDDSTNGLQNKIITNGVKHCYGDGSTTPTGVLPSGQKSITFGDTVPTTMNEGDIFFKHRGTGADYLISTDIINDLTTGGTDKVLSAEQGKLLQTNKINYGDVVDHLSATTNWQPLSANMGRVLNTYYYQTNGNALTIYVGTEPSGHWVVDGHLGKVSVLIGGLITSAYDGWVCIGKVINLPYGRHFEESDGIAMCWASTKSFWVPIQARITSDNNIWIYSMIDLGNLYGLRLNVTGLIV